MALHEHCSSCGRDEYVGYSDGYSTCCNKSMCSGTGFGSGTRTFEVVNNLFERTPLGTTKACCSGMAEHGAKTQGGTVGSMLA